MLATARLRNAALHAGARGSESTLSAFVKRANAARAARLGRNVPRAHEDSYRLSVGRARDQVIDDLAIKSRRVQRL